MTTRLPLGPVMLDLQGIEIDAREKEMLCHPLTGGVILFSRNFQSPEQLRALTRSIRLLRDPELLIAVDHEGGRVQRFREGFSALPSMSDVGLLWSEPERARKVARAVGTIIAYELLDHGLDFSFTPVLDVAFGRSSVIGNRAFSADPMTIAALAGELIAGMHEGGAASVGKHFPGHGHVLADSHVAIPVDERSRADIEQSDLVPYRLLIPAGLRAIMPAHVIYPSVHEHPAGFSRVWLQDILRQSLGFGGMIFSDDLAMEGASTAGDIVARARAACEAGCDMVLICNSPTEAEVLLSRFGHHDLHQARAAAMRAKAAGDQKVRYREAGKTLSGAIR